MTAARLTMSLLRFDGRVAVVTGAGRGLGREYALLLASRGAKVVVNDLGGDSTGLGKNSSPVDEVVSAIKAQGGTAVPNYDSVEYGEKIIKTAIDKFGRIDILINNAGIIRDKTITRISDQDWDLVHKVHLRGSFMCTRAAWDYMKKQKYGRIIMTSSPSGLYGNFGQSNYSAAKLGIVGFMNTLALEGQKYNIYCNTIAPTAFSRLTDGILPRALAELFLPEHIAPVVVYMCHESCNDNGIIIESAGGWAGKTCVQNSTGVAMIKPNEPFTVENVRDNWNKICDMSEPLNQFSNAERTGHIVKCIQEKLSGGNEPTDIDSAIGYEFTPTPFSYTEKDVILYALGIGATVSEKDISELKFLYEGHDEFSVIPSYAVIPAQSAMTSFMIRGLPGFKYDLSQLLHGEQYIELKKPLPTSGTLTHKAIVRDIVDKKKGALVIIDVESFDESGDVVCINQFVTFIIRAGGFGGKRDSPHLKPTVAPPDRAPDASIKEKTTSSQAALYRLNGDYNPLHIDPQFAAIAGFSTPILHGLCSYGFAVRHILKQYCDNDVKMIKTIKSRFAKPVLPGQTLQTDMWNVGNRVFFRCKALESGDNVLTGGYIDLNTTAKSASSSTVTSPSSGDGLQSTVLFEQMQSMVESGGPELVKKVRAIYLWNITKNGKTAAQWTVDLKTPPGRLYRGEPQGVKAGCTMTIDDDNFVALANGDLNPQQAFFQGKIKITGNVMLSQKLQQLFGQQSNL